MHFTRHKLRLSVLWPFAAALLSIGCYLAAAFIEEGLQDALGYTNTGIVAGEWRYALPLAVLVALYAVALLWKRRWLYGLAGSAAFVYLIPVLFPKFSMVFYLFGADHGIKWKRDLLLLLQILQKRSAAEGPPMALAQTVFQLMGLLLLLAALLAIVVSCVRRVGECPERKPGRTRPVWFPQYRDWPALTAAMGCLLFFGVFLSMPDGILRSYYPDGMAFRLVDNTFTWQKGCGIALLLAVAAFFLVANRTKNKGVKIASGITSILYFVLTLFPTLLSVFYYTRERWDNTGLFPGAGSLVSTMLLQGMQDSSSGLPNQPGLAALAILLSGAMLVGLAVMAYHGLLLLLEQLPARRKPYSVWLRRWSVVLVVAAVLTQVAFRFTQQTTVHIASDLFSFNLLLLLTALFVSAAVTLRRELFVTAFCLLGVYVFMVSIVNIEGIVMTDNFDEDLTPYQGWALHWYLKMLGYALKGDQPLGGTTIDQVVAYIWMALSQFFSLAAATGMFLLSMLHIRRPVFPPEPETTAAPMASQR